MDGLSTEAPWWDVAQSLLVTPSTRDPACGVPRTRPDRRLEAAGRLPWVIVELGAHHSAATEPPLSGQRETSAPL
jgi:hypothetical protein